MAVSYTAPLGQGFRRMKDILFHPFDLVQWLIIGFGAWLASLAGAGDKMAGGSADFDNSDIEGMVGSIPEIVNNKFEMFMAGTAFTILALSVLAAILVLYVAIQFVSSRGEFIFLENIVKKRGAVGAPWREYSSEGNSLFFWRVFFEIIFFTLLVATMFVGLLVFLPGVFLTEWMPASVATLVVVLWFLLVLFVVAAYLKLFLKDFVVPIMYKKRIGILAAWRYFLDLFRSRPLEFLLYGLFVVVLYLLALVAVLIFALVTCCVGPLLISIPYVGAVMLLPLYATYRGFSVYFLQQFGPELELFEDELEEPSPS